MIQLIPFIPSDEIDDELKQLYFTAFPEDERRNWEQLKELIRHNDFKLYKIIRDHIFVGMITVWHWVDFTFIEHFAIVESLRGNGIGSQVITSLIKEYNHTIVLEVDEPVMESAFRRIDFYTRLGFNINQQIYYQPPYHQNNKPLKMLLMSFPEKVSKTKFNLIRAKLYMEVYKCNDINFP